MFIELTDLKLGKIIVNSELIAYIIPPESIDVKTAVYFTDFPMEEEKVRMVEEDYELIKKLLKAIPITKTPVRVY